jgi:hypothetical protein
MTLLLVEEWLTGSAGTVYLLLSGLINDIPLNTIIVNKITSHMSSSKIKRDNQSTKTVMDLTKQPVYVRKRKGKEIGEIEAVNKDTIVVKKGKRGGKYYYIPIDKLEGWDGHVVCLTITDDEAKQYEKKAKPDKSQYFTKDQGYGSAAIEKDKTLSEKLPFVRVIKRAD